MISTADKDCKLGQERWPRKTRASRFQFELATPDDDAELCRLIRAVTMEGSIPLRFGREPSFFGALSVEGSFHQVIVCRDTHTGRAVGVAVRSVRDRHVNGRVMPTGYLSSLRFLPEYRRLGLVARGFGLLRELHGDGRTKLYLTTIATGNASARQTLLGGRAGLPRYHPAATFQTYVLRVPSRRRNFRRALLSESAIDVNSAEITELAELVQFWNAVGSERQFFPYCTIADFGKADATFRGLSLDNLLVARRNDRIVGTLGVWDQTAFRQIEVAHYSPWLTAVRPLYNTWAAAVGRPALPPAGRTWPVLLAALPVVANGEAEVLQALLDEQLRRVAGRERTHLLLGLCQADPLAGALAPWRCASYSTDLHLVAWDDGERLRLSLDGRIPYLELGCL